MRSDGFPPFSVIPLWERNNPHCDPSTPLSEDRLYDGIGAHHRHAAGSTNSRRCSEFRRDALTCSLMAPRLEIRVQMRGAGVSSRTVGRWIGVRRRYGGSYGSALG